MAGSIVIVEADEVLAKLALLGDLHRVLAPPTRTSLALLKGRMQHYPPSPPGSTYVRTYRLRAGWHYRSILSGNILGHVYNEGVEYADYVQSEASQAWMHVGRWQTEIQVADESEPEIINIFDTYLNSILQ